MPKAPFVLLINPWITDFAAYDLWAKPLGLLTLASLLREGGCGVALIDCLDRHDPLTLGRPDMLPGKDRRYGTGKYARMPIPKPSVYDSIPRRFYRYGIHPESLAAKLAALPRPDLVWVTSIMTYWYPGVQQTIRCVRDVFPGVPVWLGGIYAKLCLNHARQKSGADVVVNTPLEAIPRLIAASTGFLPKNAAQWGNFAALRPPALDLLPSLTYAVVMTSTGCPFHCPYCASHLLQPKFQRKSAEVVYAEILRWHESYGASDFAFYDDALLMHADGTLKRVLERLCREGVRLRFHTPNALHVRALSREWCELLYESGFTTLRLGLETTRKDKQKEWGGKVETEMFLSAVHRLHDAGFSASQIGVYLLCGLPGQTPADVAESIRLVRDAGAQPHLSEYSPVPGTSLWREACLASRYDIQREPLCHNNTFFACRREDFSYKDMQDLKELARRARRENDRLNAVGSGIGCLGEEV